VLSIPALSIQSWTMGLLASRQMRLVVDAARKDIGASIWRAHDQPALRRGAGLFGDLKLNRTAGLVLDNRRPVSHAAARSYVVDPKADEIVAISIAVALSDGNVVPLNSAFRWNNSMRNAETVLSYTSNRRQCRSGL
jgi:hypothetical protein